MNCGGGGGGGSGGRPAHLPRPPIEIVLLQLEVSVEAMVEVAKEARRRDCVIALKASPQSETAGAKRRYGFVILRLIALERRYAAVVVASIWDGWMLGTSWGGTCVVVVCQRLRRYIGHIGFS